jgi:ABC-2 type transport system permease protein
LSAVVVNVAAAMGIFRRDAAIFASYRARLVFQFAAGFFSVALFYYISRLVSVSQFESHDAYFAFAVIGIAIMDVVTSTLGVTPSRIRSELVAGTFERLVVSPFGPVASIVCVTIFPFLISVITAVFSIAFAAAVFGMPLHWETVPLALPVAGLAALAFAPFAFLVCAAVLAFKQAESASGLILTGLSLVGGFLFPVALLPNWIQWASEVQPFTPAVELLRHLLVNTPTSGSAATALVKLVGFMIVLFPVGLWALRMSIRYGQKRGTVTEY